jgi:uncharacterized protein (DUF1778 family)
MTLSAMAEANRTERFIFRATPDEIRMLEQLAEHEERNPSDVVRRLVRREHEAVIGHAHPKARRPAARAKGAK